MIIRADKPKRIRVCPKCNKRHLYLYQDFTRLRVTYSKFTGGGFRGWRQLIMWRRIEVERIGKVTYTLECQECKYTTRLNEDDVIEDILWEHQRHYQ